MAVRAKVSTEISRLVASWVAGGDAKGRSRQSDGTSPGSELLSSKLPRGGIGSARLTDVSSSEAGWEPAPRSPRLTSFAFPPASAPQAAQPGKRDRPDGDAPTAEGAESLLAKRMRFDERRRQRAAAEDASSDDDGAEPAELPAAESGRAGAATEAEAADPQSDSDADGQLVGGRSGALGVPSRPTPSSDGVRLRNVVRPKKTADPRAPVPGTEGLSKAARRKASKRRRKAEAAPPPPKLAGARIKPARGSVGSGGQL